MAAILSYMLDRPAGAGRFRAQGSPLVAFRRLVKPQAESRSLGSFLAWFAVATAAPWLAGAMTVAAGHVLPNQMADLPSAYFDYRLDRVLTGVNAIAGAAVTGAAVSRLARRRLRVVLAGLCFLAALPAYSLAYHGAFRIVQWLGLGWCASV